MQTIYFRSDKRFGNSFRRRGLLCMLAAAFVLLSPSFSEAQGRGAAREKPSLKLSVSPAKIWPGEASVLRVQVRNTGTDTPPDMSYLGEEFDVKYLGSEPLSHSIQITINGKTTITEDRGQTFVYQLIPKRGGTIQIEPPIVRSDGVQLEAAPVFLKVAEPEDQNLPENERRTRIELSVSPEEIYPLSAFSVTLSVYVREDSDKKNPADPLLKNGGGSPPELLFGWGLDDTIPQGLEPNEEFSDWIGGYINPRGGLSVNHLRQSNPFSLFGEHSRDLTFLPKGRLVQENGKEDAPRFWRYDFTRSFTAGEAGEYDFSTAILKGYLGDRELYAAAGPLKITVRDVPQPRPDGYVGIVGLGSGCRLAARLSSEEGRVGEALSLEMTLSGMKGNVDLHAPDLEHSETLKSRFKIYEPNEEEYEGAVRWTWNLRPLAPGEEPFPPIPLSFFDAAEGKFQTLSTGEIPLAVEAGNADLESFAAGGSPQEEPKAEGGIYGPKQLGRMTKTFPLGGMALFAGSVYTALLALSGAVYLRRRKGAGRENAPAQKGERILRGAFAENPEAVHRAVVTAFLEPLAAVRGTRADALSRREIDMLLAETARSAPGGKLEELSAEFTSLLNRLEEEKFAGGAVSVSETEVMELYRRWTAVMKEHAGARANNPKARMLGVLLLAAIPLLTGCRPDAETRAQFNRAVQIFEEADASEGSDSEKAQAFRQSAAVYEGMLAAGKESGVLLYNLGCAYYRAGDSPRALEAWRRAERYMPGDKALQANIAAVKTESSAGKKGVLETVLFWRHLLPRPAQEMLFLGLTLLTAALAAAALWSRKKRRAVLIRCAAAVFLASLLLFGSLAFDRHLDAQRGIAAAETSLRKGSSPHYETIGTLRKLDECRILSSHAGWLHVEAPDGQTGWAEPETVLVPTRP